MESRNHSRQARARGEEGVALLITLMVLMLVSALMVGFVAAVIADTRASGLDRDQTQAYAASHAGLEQITSDLATLFVTDFSPTTSQINALRTNPPALTGFSFIAPGDPRPVLDTWSRRASPTRPVTRGRRILSTAARSRPDPTRDFEASSPPTTSR